MGFAGVGGTSASAPSFAGMMTVMAQYWGLRLGQVNYILYPLAAEQNLSRCNGSSTTFPAKTCVFNDVTIGNNAVPGEANCGTPKAKYQAGVGYDLATGLGSINVVNALNQWSSVCCQFPKLGASAANDDPFSDQNVGTASVSQSQFLLNITSVTANISLSLGGANPSDFTITSNACGNSVPGEGSCMFSIQFAPTAAGLRSAYLVVDHNSPYSPTLVQLSGTGVGQVSFGGEQSGDVRVMGDFDADGQLDSAVWRSTNGFWYVYPSSNPGTLTEEQWGLPGDIPVARRL
jgi:hypothetical protein